jgi:hypothetical protein
MGKREKGTELPISVVDTAVVESTDMNMFGTWMAQLMQDIESAILVWWLTNWRNFSDLEKIIEDIMHEKGAFIVSLEQAGTDKEWTMYLKHMNDGNPIYFAVGKRTLDAWWKTVYRYDSVFNENFVNKLHALIIQKKAELKLVDTDSAADLWVLQEELLNPATIDSFVQAKLKEAQGILNTLRSDPSRINEMTLKKWTDLVYKITYAVDMLCSHPAYADQCTSYKEELAWLYGIKDEIEKRKALYAKQNSPAWDPGRFTRTLDVTSAPVDQLKVLIATDFSAIEKELARTDIDIATKRIGIQPMLARVHGYILQLQSYPREKANYEIYLEKYRTYGKQLKTLTTQSKVDYDRDVSYYVGDELINNPAFRTALATLDTQFPDLSAEQRKQVGLAWKYLTTDPEMFMTTMAAIYGNEHHSAYLEKYFALVQQYNNGEISKIKAHILNLRAEREFNNKDVGTVRAARNSAVAAIWTKMENQKREKHVTKMLRCVLQAEASERRTKMMLDIAARVKAGNVWSNALPLPNMNFGETQIFNTWYNYYPATPGDSMLRSMLQWAWYTSLDQLPKDLFDGIDMRLFPELTMVPYKMDLEGYLKTDIKKKVHGEIEADSRISRDMESFDDQKLMGFFETLVQSKEQYEKEERPEGRKPVFQEIAKRYLAQDMNVLWYMAQFWREEAKKKEMLELCLFSLVDERVIADMHTSRRIDVPWKEEFDEQKKYHTLGTLFVRSLIRTYGNNQVRTNTVAEKNAMTWFGKWDEERIKTKLATALGGSWNQNEGFEWNAKLWKIIDGHISTLPKKPFDDIDNGGSWWLDKSLEAKDYVLTTDGRWWWANRAIDMAIIGWLTSVWISPQNAAAVAGAIKFAWIWLWVFMAINWRYNNFWKGQSFINKIWKNSLLGLWLFALPLALTNKSLSGLFDSAIHGDRTGEWIVPWALLKKFSRDVKIETNKDAFQAEFMAGMAFGPMKLEQLWQYLEHRDGKYRLTGKKLQAFLNDTTVPEDSRYWIANLLAASNNSEERMSDYLHQGLERSGLNPDGSNFQEYTTKSPYKDMLFRDMKAQHMEVEMLTDMFSGILGDEATKYELSRWYLTLSPEEKVKATERIAEVKKFQAKRTETTPYVTFLLRRKELRPAPAWSVLDGMDDTKADALAAGLNEYTTKKWAYAKQYIMDPTWMTSFDELFLGGCGASKDIAKLLYADDGLQKIRAYEKVPWTADFMQTFVADYTKDWRCGTRDSTLPNETVINMNMHHLVLKNIPWISGEVMLSNEPDPSNPTQTKLSIWIKNSTSGVREEFHRTKIHETEVHSPVVWMKIGSWFAMKLWTWPWWTEPVDDNPDFFWDQFFPGIIAHLQKWDTTFRVKEDWLSAETVASAWTRPTWIRNKKNTGIWRVDPDITAKFLWPQIVFEKTGKTMP